jgi:hypothetical protein
MSSPSIYGVPDLPLENAARVQNLPADLSTRRPRHAKIGGHETFAAAVGLKYRMPHNLSRWLAASLLLSQLACKRPSGPETTRATAGGAPHEQSSAVSGKRLGAPATEGVVSSALHPALGGHPPSYWQERLQRPSSTEGPVPEEAWGGRFRYQTHIRGAFGTPCLCQDRGGACEGGPVVKGLTWSSVPWARRLNGQLEASVELVGVLSRDALTLTEPPRRPLPVNEEETLTRFPLLCASPAQGWQIRDPGRVDREHEQAAVEYAEKQAEHSATWMYWDPSLTRAERTRSPPQKGVFVFTFTENLEAHRRRLELLWGGPLCVAKGDITSQVQSGIVSHAADLLRREGRRHGLLCESFGMSSDNSNGPNHITVSALAWDPAKLSRWLSHELAGFPVHINSPLVPEPTP